MATPPTYTPGDVLTAADMNSVAMWRTGGGSYTAADPIVIDDCFSADFKNYRIVGHLYGSNATQNLAFNFRTASGIYTTAVYNRWGYTWAGGAIAGGNLAGQTAFVIGTTSNTSTELTAFTIDVFGPNEAIRTKCVSTGLTSGAIATFYNLDLAATQQFTGCQLDAAAGSLTGNVRVYGYNNL